MTKNYETSTQWAAIEKWGSTWGGFYNCLLEIRDRVEALEKSKDVFIPNDVY